MFPSITIVMVFVIYTYYEHITLLCLYMQHL